VRFAGLPPEQRTRLAAERRSDPEGVRHALAGDLDCVILNAVERDRDHRYATANA
jgi:hypothetical protein